LIESEGSTNGLRMITEKKTEPLRRDGSASSTSSRDHKVQPLYCF
jgi:hypothetical protein